MQKYHKSYSQLNWPFSGFLQLYEVKLQKSHISVTWVHKYHKSCSELIWPFYGLFQCMRKNFKNLLSPWVQCTSITNRFFSSHDRFSAFYNCMRKNFKNLISPWVQCTSIKNRVLSSLDRFTPYNNCMKKNLKNLISPWLECTSITLVFSDHLTVLRLLTTVRAKTLKISYLRLRGLLKRDEANTFL